MTDVGEEFDGVCARLAEQYRGAACAVSPAESRITLYYATPEQAEHVYGILMILVNRGYGIAREKRV